MTRRKKSIIRTVAKEPATAYQVRQMSKMVQEICKPRGYRWLAKFTTRSFGYWQHIAKRDKQCKPRVDDYNRIKTIYGILQDSTKLDSEIVVLLLEIMEHKGAMDTAITKLVNLVRRKAA